MAQSAECTKCGTDYSLGGERDPASHGMCWMCASIYAERLEGAMELIARTSTKDVERKKYAQKMLTLHGSSNSSKRRD